MKKKLYSVIGVMSGTSLDGIDLCYAKFEFKKGWHYTILKSKTIAYNKSWKQNLQKAISLESTSLEMLDSQFTSHLAKVINKFIINNKIKKIDAICSHGHTIYHKPDQGFTKQIGNLAWLATKVNAVVVCDFRVQDIELGGQGAPLVPIGDRLLFADYDYCLNLGGFANISMEKNDNRLAFDICPVNIVLNHYANKIDLEYDNEGKIAVSGELNYKLLDELNSLPFYTKKPPKSLGLEWVLAHVFPLINKYNLAIKDILRTCTEHIAIQISNHIHSDRDTKILVTGGGVYNVFLIERINTLSNSNVVIPDSQLINFKEAMIFGFLGVLKLENQVNCLSSVTGAKHDHSTGKIYKP